MVDETALVSAAQEGKESAFEELYMRNKEKIAAVVYRCVGNRQDAEDLMQDIFIKAFISIKKYQPQPGANFSSWLYRIGINCSINFLKKREKQNFYKSNPDTEVIEDVKYDRDHATPEQAALKQETREGFLIALDCLSAKQKMIFVLKHFQGLKVAEIARHMGCGAGSIRKQLYRAVLKMREKLGSFYAGAKPKK